MQSPKYLLKVRDTVILLRTVIFQQLLLLFVQKSGLKSVSVGNDRMEQSPGSVAQVLTTALSGLYKCHLVRTDGKLPQSK